MPKFKLEYDRVPANPPYKFAQKILKEAQKMGATEIESLGGGSTIDTAKFVAYNMGIPHTAIPTTAGTGSEVTRFAVFIKDGKKFSMDDPKLIPQNYILKPELITTLPPLHTASSGLDALSQCIESYWSPNATKESRKYSRDGIKYIMSNLYLSYVNPGTELFRQKMQWAANYSGRAINITTTSICHAISYPLTVHYDLPHGIGCALTLPFWIKYFGLSHVISPRRVEALMKALNVKVPKFDKDLVATEALKSKRSKNVPKEINKKLIIEALNL